MKEKKEKTSPSEDVSITPIISQDNQIVNVENLIGQAIAQKLPVETMERFFTLAKEMQAIKAKTMFNEAMAKFQSECPTIVKTKEVYTKSGALAYKYAPIESIVEQVKHALTNNGFSYSTQQEMLNNSVKITVKVTHIIGHSEITDMTVPLGTQTQMMSNTQVVAAASTFAKRYAFCNAFGILTGDEDTDARPQDLEDMPKEEIGQPQTTHPQETRKPTEKQAQFIKKLCIQKNITQPQLLEMAKGKSPSELIDALLKYQTESHTHLDPESGKVIDEKTGQEIVIPF